MNHQNYEDWLFAYYEHSDDYVQSEDALTTEQAAALDKHLLICKSCRRLVDAWEAVEAQIRGEPLLAPKPGFSARWQARLEADHQRAYQRQTFVVLAINVVGVLVLLSILVALALPLARSPEVLLWTWLYRFFTMYAFVDAARNFVATMFQTASGVIPLAWWVFFVGLLCELGVLWVVSYRLLTNPRRIMR